MGFGESPSRLHTEGMDGYVIDHRIRTSEIDVLKYAELLRPFAAVFTPGYYAAFAEYQDLSGFHIPDNLCSHRLDGTAFRSHNVHSLSGLP